MQERLEASSRGRAVISTFLVVALTAILISNLPDSVFRRREMKAVRQFLDVTGLEQRWPVFAPDPPTYTLQVVGRITYSDGRVETWHVPEGGPVVGLYRYYRWRKWYEKLGTIGDVALRRAVARWLARTHRSAAAVPVLVTIVRRVRDSPPPGMPSRRPVWREKVLYRGTFDRGRQ